MDPIRENPFRVLGLLANASEREIVRQVAKFTRFAEIGKPLTSDNDFPALGLLHRDLDAVKEAASRIEQSKNKLHWGLFWFVCVDDIDEVALNHLRGGDLIKAVEIWSLPLSKKEISRRNFSSAMNLSTIELGEAIVKTSFDPVLFGKAIRTKGQLLMSEAFGDLVSAITKANSAMLRDDAISGIIDETLGLAKPYLGKKDGLSFSRLLLALNQFPKTAQDELKRKFTDGPIHRIDKEVERAAKLRQEKPTKADTIGFGLYIQAEPELTTLKDVLGEDALQHRAAANKVANEILQCSIDFFNEHHDDDDLDPGPQAIKLVNLARALNPSGEVKDRIEENAPTIEKWVNESVSREKHRWIKPDVEFIDDQLARFQDSTDSTLNAKNLIQMCKPKLDNLAGVLGRSDKLYSTLTDAVANNAMGMLVSVVNNEQEKLDRSFGSQNAIQVLVRTVREANGTVELLGPFDMSSSVRHRYDQNRISLRELMRSLQPTTPWSAVKSPPISPPIIISTPTSGGSIYYERVFANVWEFAQTYPRLVLASSFVLAILAIGAGLGVFHSSDSANVAKNSNANKAITSPPEMVYVPGGTFPIGRPSPEISQRDDKVTNGVDSPVHSVPIKSFFIDKYPVTSVQYAEFVSKTHHRMPMGWNSKNNPPYPARGLFVTGVTWEDANDYARWKGKRLPTEEEWESAAKGFPGSVIRDKSENNWEWTSSNFKAYPGGTLPAEYAIGKNLKTIRGGVDQSSKGFDPVTYRVGWPPTGAADYSKTGFRCAKDAP